MQHNQASQAEAVGSGQMGTYTPLPGLPLGLVSDLACLLGCG